MSRFLQAKGRIFTSFSINSVYTMHPFLICNFLLLFGLFTSCNNESKIIKTTNFEIKDFTPVNNWKEEITIDSSRVKYIELDYKDAINHGATFIRIGSAIFGQRI